MQMDGCRDDAQVEIEPGLGRQQLIEGRESFTANGSQRQRQIRRLFGWQDNGRGQLQLAAAMEIKQVFQVNPAVSADAYECDSATPHAGPPCVLGSAVGSVDPFLPGRDVVNRVNNCKRTGPIGASPRDRAGFDNPTQP
jgi:hypothetical protein